MLISDLKVGQTIDGVYLVRKALKKPTKKGTFFWSLELSDKSGNINCVCWDPNPTHLPETGDSIRVEATVDEYSGKPQLIIARISLVPKDEAPSSDFLPTSARPAEEMHEELLQKIASDISNPQLKAALLEMVTGAAKSAILKAPAASSLHHCYLGGLLEHVLSLWKSCMNTWVTYPWLNRDVLLAACVLHDIGKVAEYATDSALEFTPMGRLVGHIIYGSRWAWGSMTKAKVNQELMLQILHVIASHHGQWGEIQPATGEAVLFHFADNADAKLAAIKAALDASPKPGSFCEVRALEKGLLYVAVPQ